MATFVTVHMTTCMTRQDVERLVQRLKRENESGVRLSNAYSDTVSGRLVCLWECPDQDALLAWLSRNHVKFRGSEEWYMKVQYAL